MGLGRSFLLVVLVGAALVGCTKSNATFCETVDDCESGEDCIGNACEKVSIPDAAPDASPECPEATHQCVELAPDGWTGPALREDALAGETPAICPANYIANVPTRHGLSAGGSCACSCGKAANLNCSNARIEGRDDATDLDCRLSQCFACPDTTLAPNVCTTFSPASSEIRYKRFLGTVTSGSCQPGTPADNLTPASFSDQTALCFATAAALGEGCAAGSACTELVPDGFNADMCIFQSGTHDCPEGSIFSERLLTFEGLSDQRSCTTCECDIGVGGSCGTVAIYPNSTNCSTGGVAMGICIANQGGGTPRAQYSTNPANHDCEPVAASPPPTGEAVGTDPTTVCCVPASE